MLRSIVPVTALALVFAISGCSGGGGSPAPGPGPTGVTATGAPPIVASSNPPSSTGTTSFAVQSVPAGLPVTVVNGTTTRNAGVTPTTVTPSASNFATKVTITPSNSNAPYVFLGDQRSDGNHTILYNQAADTPGSISNVATQSVARSVMAQSAAKMANVPRFFSRGSLARPHESSTSLVVQYRTSALSSAGARTSDVERSVGAASGRDIGFARNGLTTRIVDVSGGQSIESVTSQLRGRPEVASVAPERLYYKESVTPQTPNDTHFTMQNDQWSMYDISANYAWGYTHGSTGVAIAVIDTGLDFNLPDLAGKVDYAESVLKGVVTTGNAAAQDTDGHGTNVAGIAAADTNNGIGFASVGYDTHLQIYRVFPKGTSTDKYASSADSSDVAKAIYDAVAHGAKVINLSVGLCQSQGVDPVQQAAVEYALSHNVVVVAAAGNERSTGSSSDPSCSGGSSTIDFPAAYDGVISVGASALNTTASNSLATSTEYVAGYSNAGPGLSLVAPGGDPPASETSTGTPNALHWIYGLFTSTPADPSVSKCSNLNECNALFAGTSQATPHVAGAAALMLAVNPGLTPSQVKTILTATADDIGDPFQGSGRLDAYRAVAAAKGDNVSVPPPMKLNFVAFAYVPNGTNVPHVLDVSYPQGVPVATDGTFRIADIPQNAPSYKIGVWYDSNGDGKIDAGDAFGTSGTCTASAPCTSAIGITTHPVTGAIVLN